jgi:hypothetical protein
MKNILVMNVAWIGIAAAAFVVGRVSVSDSAEQADGQALDRRGSATGRPGIASSKSDADKRTGAKSSRGIAAGLSNNTGATIDRYLRETDSLVANKMFADLLLGLTADNARDLFDALREDQQDGMRFGQQMGLFLEAWGKIDGPAAIAAVQELGGDPRRRGFAALSAISGWASSDPEGAKAHIASLENGFEKSMLMQGLVSGLAKNDPDAATRYVLQIDAEQRAAAANGEGGGRDDRFRGFSVDRQMEAIANVQLRQGVKQATSWAAALPDGSVKSSAFDQLAESLVRSDPEAAAEWIKQHAGNDYAERGVREVAEGLVRNDPAAAISFVEDLPLASQPSAMQETMERWAREDPVAAGEHLTSMTGGATKDAAVSSFARAVDREDPQVAAQWASSIGDAELRTETLESVARSWMRSNAEEAQAWLPTSGLSEEAQQNIIQNPGRGRPDWGRGRGPGR